MNSCCDKMAEEKQNLCLELLSVLPTIADRQLLADAAQALNVDVPDETERVGILKLVLEYLLGDAFREMDDVQAVEALKNVFQVVRPGGAEVKQEVEEVALQANGAVAGVQTVKLQRLNEFKIKGTVGMPDEAGMLDFRNLSYQIQGARDRGYQDKEISIAVVQSIKAGLQLRGYLEGVPNLTMETLFKRLRLHFKVKDASTMFREMEQTVQWEDETEETYCYRMLRLKQDVAILSQQEPHPFNADRIQTRFQHALYTGLKHDNIRQQLKYLLKERCQPVTDDELLSRRFTKSLWRRLSTRRSSRRRRMMSLKPK